VIADSPSAPLHDVHGCDEPYTHSLPFQAADVLGCCLWQILTGPAFFNKRFTQAPPLHPLNNESYPANPSACSDDINIVAVLKAMGAESDQEVVQLIGPDEQLAALLMASIQVCCWSALLAGQVLAAAVLPRPCVHYSNSKTFALAGFTDGQ